MARNPNTQNIQDQREVARQNLRIKLAEEFLRMKQADTVYKKSQKRVWLPRVVQSAVRGAKMMMGNAMRKVFKRDINELVNKEKESGLQGEFEKFVRDRFGTLGETLAEVQSDTFETYLEASSSLESLPKAKVHHISTKVPPSRLPEVQEDLHTAALKKMKEKDADAFQEQQDTHRSFEALMLYLQDQGVESNAEVVKDTLLRLKEMAFKRGLRPVVSRHLSSITKGVVTNKKFASIKSSLTSHATMMSRRDLEGLMTSVQDLITFYGLAPSDIQSAYLEQKYARKASTIADSFATLSPLLKSHTSEMHIVADSDGGIFYTCKATGFATTSVFEVNPHGPELQVFANGAWMTLADLEDHIKKDPAHATDLLKNAPQTDGHTIGGKNIVHQEIETMTVSTNSLGNPQEIQTPYFAKHILEEKFAISDREARIGAVDAFAENQRDKQYHTGGEGLLGAVYHSRGVRAKVDFKDVGVSLAKTALYGAIGAFGRGLAPLTFGASVGAAATAVHVAESVYRKNDPYAVKSELARFIHNDLEGTPQVHVNPIAADGSPIASLEELSSAASVPLSSLIAHAEQMPMTHKETIAKLMYLCEESMKRLQTKGRFTTAYSDIQQIWLACSKRLRDEHQSAVASKMMSSTTSYDKKVLREELFMNRLDQEIADIEITEKQRGSTARVSVSKGHLHGRFTRNIMMGGLLNGRALAGRMGFAFAGAGAGALLSEVYGGLMKNNITSIFSDPGMVAENIAMSGLEGTVDVLKSIGRGVWAPEGWWLSTLGNSADYIQQELFGQNMIEIFGQKAVDGFQDVMAAAALDQTQQESAKTLLMYASVGLVIHRMMKTKKWPISYVWGHLKNTRAYFEKAVTVSQKSASTTVKAAKAVYGNKVGRAALATTFAPYYVPYALFQSSKKEGTLPNRAKRWLMEDQPSPAHFIPYSA